MNEILKALVLGVIQGLTEFLPISSTAHLRIMPSFFGWDDIGSAYTAVIQIGTMASIVIYFRKDMTMMLRSFISSLKKGDFTSEGSRLFLYVSAGTIPILVAGYTFKSLIDHEFRSLYVMSITLILFSLVMAFAEKYSKKSRDISQIKFKDALFIGFFQALALIPGTSRSGATITGAFFRNMDRASAARFSFLLSIPAILISGIYKLYDEWNLLIRSDESLIGLITATLVSGIVGYTAIWFLLLYLRTHNLNVFIYYRILLGIVVLLLLYFNIINN